MFDAIKNFVADLASGEKQTGGLADHDFRIANLIWRIADLLGVSSTERIALRQRVANRAT